MASGKHTSDLPTLLRRSHAQMYRIALALCGNQTAAAEVVEKVVRQSGRIAKTWDNDERAQRWFVHYTVLRSRTARHSVDSSALLQIATDPDAIAAIHAIQQLPMQQREAFLLHHGELMELRRIATAMDCSSSAAANHLVAAVASLKQSNLDGLGDFTTNLPALIGQLMPPAEALDRDLNRLIITANRQDWTRRILYWLRQLILLLAIAWLIRWICQHVQIEW